MNTITRLVVYLIISLVCVSVQAQEIKNDSIKNDKNFFKEAQIEKLEVLKEAIKTEEREFLKNDIEGINRRLDSDEITAAEAENLKKEAARKRAANIENRRSIIDNKIALIERNEYKAKNISDPAKQA